MQDKFTAINNPTQHYQKTMKQTLKQCKHHSKRNHMEIQKHEPSTPKPPCNNKITQTKYTH
jgi:hypothetical protein